MPNPIILAKTAEGDTRRNDDCAAMRMTRLCDTAPTLSSSILITEVKCDAERDEAGGSNDRLCQQKV